ncbi:MAG TPA: ATP-binding protein [Burkholderiaceae bacterium]|nr:ATP-binding protein [Burkholderiaceae bacterium]
MLRLPAPAFEDDARGLINSRMALRFLWVAVLVCAIGSVASVLQPFQITSTARAVLVGAQLLLGLLCIVGTRMIHALPARVLVLTAAWASVVAATLAALTIGHGAHSLDLSFFPLIVGLVAVLAGTRQALLMAVACGLIVVVLACAEADGLLPGASALARTPLSHPLITHGLLLLAGFTIGAIMLRLSNASYRAAEEREARFRGLLATAADHYWELDDALRLRRADDAGTLTASALFADRLRRPLIEVVDVSGHDAATQARALDDLRAHRSFAALRGSLRAADGRTVHLEFSGHPRVGDDGRFAGYWGVARDVSQSVRAEEEIASARDAAEAASRAKSLFLANTSHEIRTPLNGLLGLARLAMREGASEAQRRNYLAHILDSAEGLSATLTDILDLSKIEAGKLGIDAVPFRLRDALESVCHAHAAVAQAKGLQLELDVDPEVPGAVRGDMNRLRQIVGNFVVNAIKFTEQGSVRIAASCTGRDARIRVSVIDTGIGIGADAQRRLFQPFSQADPSTTRRYGGTGLGLSICRELARLMGGEVGVRSTSGAGSEFWVELPMAMADDSEIQRANSTEADDVQVLRGARVLIGEDNAVNMVITSGLLEQWGVLVSQAEDGIAVVDAVQAAELDGTPFHAVLMDLQMPRLSGHAAARELREHLGDRVPPIIALTAAALVGERDEALRSGMCEFLTKPVHAERLRSVLAFWIGHGRGA